jgi:hypothetical protein
MGASVVLRRFLARRAVERAAAVEVSEFDATPVYIFVYRNQLSTSDDNTAWCYSIEPLGDGAEPLASGTGRTENAALANAQARAVGLRLDNVVAVHWGIDRQAWQRELARDTSE